MESGTNICILDAYNINKKYETWFFLKKRKQSTQSGTKNMLCWCRTNVMWLDPNITFRCFKCLNDENTQTQGADVIQGDNASSSI